MPGGVTLAFDDDAGEASAFVVAEHEGITEPICG